MLSYDPPTEVNFFKKVGYALVTAPITLRQPGQVCFLGRYYVAELLKPQPIELEAGTAVLVFGEKGFSLVVEKDEFVYQ